MLQPLVVESAGTEVLGEGAGAGWTGLYSVSMRFPQAGQKEDPGVRMLSQYGHTVSFRGFKSAVRSPQEGQNTGEPSSFFPQ